MRVQRITVCEECGRPTKDRNGKETMGAAAFAEAEKCACAAEKAHPHKIPPFTYPKTRQAVEGVTESDETFRGEPSVMGLADEKREEDLDV